MTSFNLRGGYEHPDRGDDPQADPFAAADMRMARIIGGFLEMNYPGHPWAVSVQHAQGVVLITIPALMRGWKYVVHLHDLKSDPGMRCIHRACGEILERLNLPRQAFSHTQYVDALLSQPIARRRNDPVPG